MIKHLTRNVCKYSYFESVHPLMCTFLKICGLVLVHRNSETNTYTTVCVYRHIPAVISLVMLAFMFLLNCYFISIAPYTIAVYCLIEITSCSYSFLVQLHFLRFRTNVAIFFNSLGPKFRRKSPTCLVRSMFGLLKWSLYLALLICIYTMFGFKLHGFQLFLVFIGIITNYILPKLIDSQFFIMLNPLVKIKCNLKATHEISTEQLTLLHRKISHRQLLITLFDKVNNFYPKLYFIKMVH